MSRPDGRFFASGQADRRVRALNRALGSLLKAILLAIQARTTVPDVGRRLPGSFDENPEQWAGLRAAGATRRFDHRTRRLVIDELPLSKTEVVRARRDYTAVRKLSESLRRSAQRATSAASAAAVRASHEREVMPSLAKLQIALIDGVGHRDYPWNLANDALAAIIRRAVAEADRLRATIEARRERHAEGRGESAAPFDFVNDVTCIAIVKALAAGPETGMRPKALETRCGGERVKGTLKDRLRRMSEAGFIEQSARRMPWRLLEKGRRRFAAILAK